MWCPQASPVVSSPNTRNGCALPAGQGRLHMDGTAFKFSLRFDYPPNPPITASWPIRDVVK
jgi:hypothetical protein